MQVDVELNENLVQQQNKAFARLLVSDKETRKRIKKIIREEFKDAVKRLQEDVKYDLENDPRKAFKGIKYSVYKRILGGNLSILNPRKAGQRYMLVKERTLDPFKRGGNRRTRSSRTTDIETYFGKDRAFILRFLNSGTLNRNINFTSNPKRKVDKWNKHPNSGNRGSIAARNWFADMAPKELELAAGNLSAIIEEELAEAYNEEIK